VLGGSGPSTLSWLETVPWNGLDTAISVAGQPAYVAVVAVDAAGKVIGTSPAVPATP
jgi:hypothetical protein